MSASRSSSPRPPSRGHSPRKGHKAGPNRPAGRSCSCSAAPLHRQTFVFGTLPHYSGRRRVMRAASPGTDGRCPPSTTTTARPEEEGGARGGEQREEQRAGRRRGQRGGGRRRRARRRRSRRSRGRRGEETGRQERGARAETPAGAGAGPRRTGPGGNRRGCCQEKGRVRGLGSHPPRSAVNPLLGDGIPTTADVLHQPACAARDHRTFAGGSRPGT